MKRLAVLTCLGLVTLIALVALSFPSGVAMAKNGTTHFGPYRGSSTDSGTCGNNWANDTFKRDFFVTDNGDGTFTLRENFTTGRFVTVAGASPGACEPGGGHGSLVDAGVTGNFKGFEVGTVTGGTFNPKGKCGNPCTTAGFVSNVFGSTAQYSCLGGPGNCSFNFAYHARGNQGLIYKHWVNASTDYGSNRGDIANQ